MMLKEKTQAPLDRLAVTLSGLCVLHCLLTPLAIILFPIVSLTFATDEWFHKMLLGFVLPVSVYSLLLGCFRHKDNGVVALGVAGLTQLVLAAYLGHEILGEIGERLATTTGGLTVAVAHLRNYRLCREDECHT